MITPYIIDNKTVGINYKKDQHEFCGVTIDRFNKDEIIKLIIELNDCLLSLDD